MADTLSDLRALAEELEFHGEDCVHACGKELRPSAMANRFILQTPGYPELVAQLGQRLYDHYYTRGDVEAFLRAHRGRGGHGHDHAHEHGHAHAAAGQAAEPEIQGLRAVAAGGAGHGHNYPDRLLEPTYCAHLHEVNASRFSAEHGYALVERRENEVVVRRGDVVRTVEPAAFDEKSGRLWLDKGSWTVQPGWYHVRGEQEHTMGVPGTARLYWSFSRHGGIRFVRAVTEAFNAAEIPFHAKTTSDPQNYTRSDAAVLYLARDDWLRAAPLIAAIYEAVAPYTRETTPALTKRLARGLAAADDPGSGRDSFGTSRVRLIAEGLWDAYKEGAPDADARLAAIVRRFERAGIRVEQPWLEPGNADIYELKPREIVVPTVEVSA